MSGKMVRKVVGVNEYENEKQKQELLKPALRLQVIRYP